MLNKIPLFLLQFPLLRISVTLCSMQSLRLLFSQRKSPSAALAPNAPSVLSFFSNCLLPIQVGPGSADGPSHSCPRSNFCQACMESPRGPLCTEGFLTLKLPTAGPSSMSSKSSDGPSLPLLLHIPLCPPDYWLLQPSCDHATLVHTPKMPHMLLRPLCCVRPSAVLPQRPVHIQCHSHDKACPRHTDVPACAMNQPVCLWAHTQHLENDNEVRINQSKAP